MLEKYDKVITTSIIAAVAIILITSVLIPVIDDASQGTETETEAEGAYGTLMYQGTPEDDASYPYRFLNTTYSDGVLSIKTGPANALVVVATINISELSNTPQIIYADDNQIIYIDNSLLQFSGTITNSDVSLNNAVNVQYYNNKMTYSDGNGNQYVDGKITYYYRCSDTGDYANFEGNNPPAMDTPSVSVDGVYIGEKYITETVTPPYAAVLNVIPILMIVGVIVTVIGVVLYQKRDV